MILRRNDPTSLRPALCALVVLVLSFSSLAGAQSMANLPEPAPPRDLARANLVEHLGEVIPRDVIFRDENGLPGPIGRFLDGRRPVVLNLMYNKCPMLCSMVLNGLIKGLTETDWSVGQQYQVVTVSIDPRDTIREASDRRRTILARYNRPTADQGWHFLVGSETDIHRIADAVGFQYFYDEKLNEYAHPAVVILLTPDGKIARYLYGIQFASKDLKFGLLEASEGRSVTTVERLLMYCYHYDPQGKRYALIAVRVMQLGGVLTMLVLGVFLGGLWYRERLRRDVTVGDAQQASGPTDGPDHTHPTPGEEPPPVTAA